MNDIAPVFREETIQDRAREALAATEWHLEVDPEVNSRWLRCAACRGRSSASPDITGDGHKYWCPVADSLKELGQSDVDQQLPPAKYLQFLAHFRSQVEAGVDTSKIAYDIVHDARKYHIMDDEVVAKVFRELGIRRIQVVNPAA